MKGSVDGSISKHEYYKEFRKCVENTPWRRGKHSTETFTTPSKKPHNYNRSAF